MTNFFVSIEEAITRLKQGEMIILLDDEERENEGDLVIAAEFATAENINFMALHGRGLICLPMSVDYIDKLGLPLMTSHNRSPYGTAFTVSIEARRGVSTGISTHDRAHTIQVAIDDASTADDIVSPGHMFPLRARAGGVLERAGQTEGSVDLMHLAGLKKAAVICEIMNSDGSMSRLNELKLFSETHGIPLVRIADLIDYRIQHEVLVNPTVTSSVPLQDHGDFQMTVFTNYLDDLEHFALIKPPKHPDHVPLVRIHSECITGDIFGSCKCDCGMQLQRSLALIAKEGGVLVYLRQEGRGIGLSNKLKAYNLQQQGYDTVEANLALGLPADSRNYAIAFQILNFLGMSSLRLLTNNPKKVEALEKYGLIVSERISLAIEPTHQNRDYLRTKQLKLGHLLSVD